MPHPRPTRTSITIWTLLLVGFAAMVFPGVLFFGHRSEPMMLGFPFIYGYITLWWVYMCAVLFWAYRVSWGGRATRGEGVR